MRRRRGSYLYILFPVILIFLFLLEGSICKVFSNVLFLKFPMVPYLTLLWFVFAVLFEDNINLHLYWWAFGIGIVYDVYYVGVVGIFTFLFPLIVFLDRVALKYIDENLLTSTGIYCVDVLVVIVLSYIGDRIAHIAFMSGTQMLLYTLLPTLILNIILFVIFYFPVSWFFDRFR